jgi:hypothetical protein
VNDHIGTRRISLNIRFGRPGGSGLQREDHLFPVMNRHLPGMKRLSQYQG